MLILAPTTTVVVFPTGPEVDPPWNCDFGQTVMVDGSNECGMSDDETTSWKWTQITGFTPTEETGPQDFTHGQCIFN